MLGKYCYSLFSSKKNHTCSTTTKKKVPCLRAARGDLMGLAKSGKVAEGQAGLKAKTAGRGQDSAKAMAGGTVASCRN